MAQPNQQRDYFAEMFVAGMFADEGWNDYFPRRDQGFDFIVTKQLTEVMLVRPVQVKGKYPEPGKTDKLTYGYVGKLTALHPDMVLSIPFFDCDDMGDAPILVAFMPYAKIKTQASKGYRCMPARFRLGKPEPRPDFLKYFGWPGLRAAEDVAWN